MVKNEVNKFMQTLFMEIVQTNYLIFLVNRTKQRIKKFENFAPNIKKKTHITKFLRIFSKSTFSATISLSTSYNESIMTELYE